MPLAKFNTPAFQGPKDFKDQPALSDAFATAWSNYVSYCTKNSQMGNPWTSTLDHPRSWYFNPMVTEVTPDASNTVYIQWGAFPNRINHYFKALFQSRFSDWSDKLYELADIGPAAFSKKYKIDLVVPQNPCDSKDTDTKAFGPKGPRGWQDEYCEWSVARDVNGNIISVDFTHENPEYWFHMWRISPEKVLSLYQEILRNKNIKLEDLYLYDSANNPIIVRETGTPAYNPINKWNSGSDMSAISGGAVHLTSPPNSLGAEIYLGAAATILRSNDGGKSIINNANELICAAQYGQIYRNSDPRIGQSVNQLVNNKNSVMVTLTNPIALYGQKPNFNMIQLPSGANKKVEECYTIVRGVDSNSQSGSYYPNNMILHARFAAPEGANFLLSEILVNGNALNWGSQLADTFQVQLAGTGIEPPKGQSPEIFGPVADAPVSLPNLQYLLDYNLLEASLSNKLNTLSNLTSCITQVEAGSSTSGIAILTDSAQKNTGFDFGPGINVNVLAYRSLGDAGQLFVVSIDVEANVPLGEKPLSLYNNASDPRFPVTGVLEVVAAGSLPRSAPKASTVTPLAAKYVKHLKTILK